MKSDFQSKIKGAKGLGASGNGTTHFIHQRVSAIALVPLCVWFVICVILMLRHPKDMIPPFIISPINIAFLIIFICTFLYHGLLGTKVIIEDYVHCRYGRIAAMLALYFVTISTAVCGIVSVFDIHIIFRTIGLG